MTDVERNKKKQLLQQFLQITKLTLNNNLSHLSLT